jgi:ABC-2 type transport system permease protein
MKNEILLLKTLFLSTSGLNILRYSDDRKKKRQIIAGSIGALFLYLMLMAYSILVCIGYGVSGLTRDVPVMCVLIISAMAFIFTLLKTNGYLFNFKEYDMLMSLPFEARTVAGCRFFYMYIKSLSWYLSISAAMLIGYSLFVHPPVFVYPVWMLLTLVLPVIPMLGAAFLGFLIARISAGFKKTNIIQTVLTFAFVILCFAFRFILEAMFENDQVGDVLEKASEMTGKAVRVYRPALWFSNAVTKGDFLAALILIFVSMGLCAVLFVIVGNSYMNINSALKSHVAAGKYRVRKMKRRSVLMAIAFKEFRRMTGSTTYMVNGAMGELLSLILGLAALFIGFDRIAAIVTEGAPLDSVMLQPAIPFIVYFLLGMMATTVCSPSLEGKNYWIVQSLPIEKKTLYQGKMLFNMLLTLPFMVFATLCLCISAGVTVPGTLLYLALGAALCAFSTAWGCVCGIRFMRLDWENEVEVIKQGRAVVIYMFPNMIVAMGMVVLAVILGMRMDHRILTMIFIMAASLLAGLSYLRAMALAER